MWLKLILHSLRRDFRKKTVALFAVMLATCLATFLLHWSLSLGDKIQTELRAFGANILLVPEGETINLAEGDVNLGPVMQGKYLNAADLAKLRSIFWGNQITALAPLLQREVTFQGSSILVTGTEFGKADAKIDYRKVSPYLSIRGRWPQTKEEAVIGVALAGKYKLKPGDKFSLPLNGGERSFEVVGIVESGGAEDRQIFLELSSAQALLGLPGKMNQLLVSALVTAPNRLYQKYQRNPNALTPREMERYSCTPYITSIAKDVQEAIPGSEARIVRRINQSEEKIASKVNWLMALVTLAGLIAASLTTTSTTTGMVLERKKELALMKAIGSQNLFIAFYIFAEILLIGTIGCVAGFALGSLLSIGLSRTLFESAFELKWIVLPLVWIIGTAIVFCGSLWPLRQAIGLEPAQVLKDL